MSKAWNSFGLTMLQFQFCCEYLKNGYNAEQAHKKVYGDKYRNADKVMRSKNVIKYLRHRLSIVVEAAEIDHEWLIKALKKQLEDESAQVRAAASATLQRALKAKADIEARFQEIEISKNNTDKDFNINISYDEH